MYYVNLVLIFINIDCFSINKSHILHASSLAMTRPWLDAHPQVDADGGSSLDFTMFVKVVRKCNAPWRHGADNWDGWDA